VRIKLKQDFLISTIHEYHKYRTDDIKDCFEKLLSFAKKMLSAKAEGDLKTFYFKRSIRLIEGSKEIMAGLLQTTSSVWSKAIKHGKDSNTRLSGLGRNLAGAKEQLKSLDSLIQRDLRRLKKINTAKYNDEYKLLSELYGVYSQMHQLVQKPGGSLVTFNKKVEDLNSDFNKALSKLRISFSK
jgi:hypothetical protein